MKITLIYITTPNPAEAEQIGGTVVRERLAACANIFNGVTSLFEWNSNLCREKETVLVLKTTTEKTDPLTQRIKQLHSYDCPCIIALPIESGNPDFLDWIQATVSGQRQL